AELPQRFVEEVAGGVVLVQQRFGFSANRFVVFGVEQWATVVRREFHARVKQLANAFPERIGCGLTVHHTLIARSSCGAATRGRASTRGSPSRERSTALLRFRRASVRRRSEARRSSPASGRSARGDRVRDRARSDRNRVLRKVRQR